MKFSFSTLGCPDWEWEDILATTKDLGFDGVEIRGIGKEIDIPNAKPFLPQNIDKTKAQLNKMNIEISCFSSDCRLNEEFKVQAHLKTAKEYIDTASAAGVKFVRVLADTSPAPSTSLDLNLVAGHLKELCQYAENKDVTILVETNGVFADSNEMLKLISTVDHKSFAVLWDFHHPYRFFNEPISLTYNRLKQHIKYVHAKDSKMVDGKVAYQLAGHGDVPIKEALDLLKNDGYEGYFTLEWVKRWCPDLAEPGIVFPLFISYVK